MMSANTWTRTAAAGVAAAIAVVGTGASSDAVSEPVAAAASITGSARIRYAPNPADDVRFAVDARAVAVDSGVLPNSADAGGTVRVSHWRAAENQTVWLEGRVDCGVVAGRVAVLSAVITDASPDAAQFRGQHMGFTVLDSGPDRPAHHADQIGWTGPTTDALACTPTQVRPGPIMSVAPFLLVSSGGFRVRPARR